MKEMVYKNELIDGKNEVLYKGLYEGYVFYILSLQTHPCSYIILSKNDKFYNESYPNISNINCHGGFTYSSNQLILNKTSGHIEYLVKPDDEKWVIGWDYVHWGDQFGLISEGHKWKTEELVAEAKNVIEQMISDV